MIKDLKGVSPSSYEAVDKVMQFVKGAILPSRFKGSKKDKTIFTNCFKVTRGRGRGTGRSL